MSLPAARMPLSPPSQGLTGLTAPALFPRAGLPLAGAFNFADESAPGKNAPARFGTEPPIEPAVDAVVAAPFFQPGIGKAIVSERNARGVGEELRGLFSRKKKSARETPAHQEPPRSRGKSARSQLIGMEKSVSRANEASPEAVERELAERFDGANPQRIELHAFVSNAAPAPAVAAPRPHWRKRVQAWLWGLLPLRP
jgi:hypothetical protein